MTTEEHERATQLLATITEEREATERLSRTYDQALITAQSRVHARRSTLLDADLRTAIGTVGQGQGIAGIDEVRVGDLGVDIPDLRP